MPSPPTSSAIDLVVAWCVRHGDYQGYQVTAADGSLVTQSCPRCADEQFERDTRVEREARERRRLDERMRVLHETAGIPRLFKDRTFEDFRAVTDQQKHARAVCAVYAEQWEKHLKAGKGLMLLGNTGTGKTHLACSIGNHIIRRHQGAVSYGKVSDYAREVRSTFGRQKGERTEKQVMRALTHDAQLMILDEIGAQQQTDFNIQLVFDLIDGRYSEGLPIVVCSNLNAKQLEAYIGERAMDRLRQVAPVVAFPWDSYRGKQQADLC